MNSTCIKHPVKQPLIQIKAWQVYATDGDYCAAALLSFFEYWHNHKLDAKGQTKKKNDVAEMHGDGRVYDESLLQFHTEKELAIGLLGLYRETKINDAICILKNKGFISIHKNPNPRYKFDNTHYYLFHPENVQFYIDNHYPQRHVEDFDGAEMLVKFTKRRQKATHRGGNFTGREGEITSPSGEITGTITEITSEITPKTTTETISSSPVKPDSDEKDRKSLKVVNQTFPEKLDDLVHQISQIASKINFYILNTYRDYFRNHGKQIFKQLALRVSRQEISKEDLSAVFSEMEKNSDFSVLQFLLELVNRSEKYTEHTALVDFISIFSDGMVSNFPAEALAISKLRKWVKEGKFTLLDVEDCFLWMQFCSGRNYDVTLTTVPKAMSGFLQKRKQMPNGRYTVEGFNYYKTKEEKTVEILRNRDYDDDTILEKEKAYKDLVKSLTGK